MKKVNYKRMFSQIKSVTSNAQITEILKAHNLKVTEIPASQLQFLNI